MRLCISAYRVRVPQSFDDPPSSEELCIHLKRYPSSPRDTAYVWTQFDTSFTLDRIPSPTPDTVYEVVERSALKGAQYVIVAYSD